MMNPSPTEIVELFSFVEVTLIQYATIAGHFLGVAASSVKPKPINATTPTTPRPKPKAQPKGNPQNSPAKVKSKPPDAKREVRWWQGQTWEVWNQNGQEKTAVYPLL